MSSKLELLTSELNLVTSLEQSFQTFLNFSELFSEESSGNPRMFWNCSHSDENLPTTSRGNFDGFILMSSTALNQPLRP